MKRRTLLLAAGALAAPLRVRGQTSTAVPRIGVLYYSETYTPIVEGLRAGLKELGLVEGRDLMLEMRNGHGDVSAIEAAARQFERERVALLYSAPTTTTRAVKRATSVLPVVFCAGTDPVHMGLVASYAQPGGRFTGVHYLTADLTAKRIELLRDLLPKARRLITFYNPDNPAAQESARNAREAAPRFGFRLTERQVRSEPDLRDALAALNHGEADAILFVSDALVSGRSPLIFARARALRLPTITYDVTLAERGALAAYGVDTREVGRQSAKYVQRILGGARAADLPVENVTRLTFVLNRRTANEIGLTVPPAMLVRFDRVIE